MKKGMWRRQFLGMGIAAGGFLVGTGADGNLLSAEQEGPIPFPWKYRTLDVSTVRARAYNSYFKAGCMFGVFESVAGSVADQLGKPYSDFPFALSAYGGGGVASYGSLCGTCNGAAMAISLFHQGDLRNRLIHDVFTWYETSKLPVFVPLAPAKVAKEYAMEASRPDSVLCHISIMRWTKVSGSSSFSPERLERCARLVADVAGYAADVLNKTQGEYSPKMLISTVAAGCLECHAQGKQAPNEPEVVSRMACTTCHETAHHQRN